MRLLRAFSQLILEPIFSGGLWTAIGIFLAYSAIVLLNEGEINHLVFGFIMAIPAFICGAMQGFLLSMILLLFSKTLFENPVEDESYRFTVYVITFISALIIAATCWYFLLGIMPYGDAGSYIEHMPPEQFAFLMLVSLLVAMRSGYQWAEHYLDIENKNPLSG